MPCQVKITERINDISSQGIQNYEASNGTYDISDVPAVYEIMWSCGHMTMKYCYHLLRALRMSHLNTFCPLRNLLKVPLRRDLRYLSFRVLQDSLDDILP